jgi:hypothetical protein
MNTLSVTDLRYLCVFLPFALISNGTGWVACPVRGYKQRKLCVRESAPCNTEPRCVRALLALARSPYAIRDPGQRAYLGLKSSMAPRTRSRKLSNVRKG